MDERSLKWKQNWPDTVEGVIKKLVESKKNQRKKDVAFVKAFRESEDAKIRQDYSAIAEAKEKIFNSTCYGIELISTLLESKVIEEREAQIEFRNVIAKDKKEQEDALQAKIASMSNNLYDFYKKDEDAAAKRKQDTEGHAKINKIMHEELTEKNKKAKQEEQRLELEDTRLMKQLLDFEKHEKANCKEQRIREYDQYLEDQRAFQEAKKKREQLDDELTAKWRSYQDRIRCRERRVWQEIINEKTTSNQHKQLYEMIQKVHENENKTYEDFVNKGIKKAEERILEEDTNLAKKEKLLSERLHKQMAETKRSVEEVEKLKRNCNILYCDRTCIIPKSSHKLVDSDSKDKDVQKPVSFLAPKNKLVEALKKREQQPSEWTALKGSHQYFADKANSILKECKHKKMAQKVVDNYRKVTGMDSTILPIPNY
ncbi:golgin subfamily A member 6-like protein 22 isoform X2 [Pectinophora gossypiella]|nr:golgin subfamily A member 6-like protein 22 isoform X2 [Pectinophora gossypiella]XP_049875817.1 golgin subfamily A member 6-like protein 22 isoform X2 [Pectinophora gossypiella]XP_049875818.1 golgin subfamily A member 6-like protein 22 isoform X2 [Pectinophora gossypiella]